MSWPTDAMLREQFFFMATSSKYKLTDNIQNYQIKLNILHFYNIS